ncbi:hypothetical protein DXG01_006486 [Tephrocybe rancida]|nr:hypothetical protein DXG01_006486 [Tephrocybe rancida]
MHCHQIATLDGLDGGISVYLHCPGFQPPVGTKVEDLTIEAAVTPRELAEVGKPISKSIAMLIQAFGSEMALPHLERVQLSIDGTSYLPDGQNGKLIRAQCRRGRAVDLAKEIANANILPGIQRKPGALVSPPVPTSSALNAKASGH